jgi:hypothetical protein
VIARLVSAAVFFALAASLSGSTRAEDTAAPGSRTLEPDCRAWAKWVDSGFKSGSLKKEALRCVDTITGYREMGTAIGGGWCAPDDVTNAQYIRAVLKYVEDHPSRDANETGAVLALRAWKTAYPCPEGR